MLSLWSVGRYDMGLTDEEFYALTPRQFAALYDRLLEQRKHLELIIGHNTAATYNSSFSPPSKPVAPARFMPSLLETPKPPRKPNRKQIAENVRATLLGLSILRNSQRESNGTHSSDTDHRPDGEHSQLLGCDDQGTANIAVVHEEHC